VTNPLRADDLRWTVTPPLRCDSVHPALHDDTTDVRDLVIHDQAERIASLEADISIYRQLVHVLLDAVQAWRRDPAQERGRERDVIKDLQALVVTAFVRLSESP
jgi:hypothetical protein